MMNCPIENEALLATAAACLAEIEAHPPFMQLLRMQQLVISSGGTWDLPHSDPEIYKPLLCSMQLAGVHAYSKSADELPAEWMKAARAAIEFQHGEVSQ